MFSDEDAFRFFYYPISLTATEGACSGLWYSGWSIPVSSMLILVTFEPSSESAIFIVLFQHIGFGWIAMLLYAQGNFLHNTCC